MCLSWLRGCDVEDEVGGGRGDGGEVDVVGLLRGGGRRRRGGGGGDLLVPEGEGAGRSWLGAAAGEYVWGRERGARRMVGGCMLVGLRRLMGFGEDKVCSGLATQLIK